METLLPIVRAALALLAGAAVLASALARRHRDVRVHTLEVLSHQAAPQPSKFRAPSQVDYF
jgi:hypothetical protein